MDASSKGEAVRVRGWRRARALAAHGVQRAPPRCPPPSQVVVRCRPLSDQVRDGRGAVVDADSGRSEVTVSCPRVGVSHALAAPRAHPKLGVRELLWGTPAGAAR